ncbi:F28N24.16 protein [Citrus sinensis]|nr:F28N24.16 protein [Citrus sinensis]
MKLVAVVATALCFTSLLSFALAAKDPKTVEGLVYCDSCRVKYKTELSDYIAGATVALECKESEGGEVVYSREVVSDQSGTYKIPIEGCHAKLCQVRLVKSPKPECSEIVADGLSSARIDLTPSVGSDPELIRYANDLGFMKKESLPECAKVLEEMFIHG